MKSLKRIGAIISARIESVAESMENHSEIADATLREAKRGEAKARIRLQKVRRDQEKLTARKEEVTASIESWAERAKKNAGQNKELALECLKRKKQKQAQLEQLEREIENHQNLEAGLSSRIEDVTSKLQTLSLRANVLKAREQCSEMELCSQNDFGEAEQLSELLERWDDKVSEQEFVSEAHSVDALEQEFDSAEAQAELEAELAELMQEEK